MSDVTVNEEGGAERGSGHAGEQPQPGTGGALEYEGPAITPSRMEREREPGAEVKRVVKKLNIVLEGGGVKGIALVGALRALDDRIAQFNEEEKPIDNVKWEFSLGRSRYAGTSAGAVVTALLAAGYTTSELATIISSTEFSRFADRGPLARIPVVGRPLNMVYGALTKLGMFRGDYFLDFIRSTLRDKGVRTFGDLIDDHSAEEGSLQRYKLYVTASDITRGRMVFLPTDLNWRQYGVNPDEMDVALAVRMSMSVPFVFQPVTTTGENGVVSYFIDGGFLSNFPLEIFDPSLTRKVVLPQEEPATIGVRILRDRYHNIKFPGKAVRALYALASTAVEAHDYRISKNAVDELKWARAIEINTEAVPVFKWNITRLEKEILYNEGYRAMWRTATPEYLWRLIKVDHIIRTTYQTAAGGPGAGAPAPDLLQHLRRP
ncbi:patatin-like phospholipase family protein [Sorangium sp. So ce291]|uniref:patatin-like phospholipase family protein n=1 Tax=Sorangium sp. So ce291 TaxID=3133294 RepID=UPI003F63F964